MDSLRKIIFSLSPKEARQIMVVLDQKNSGPTCRQKKLFELIHQKQVKNDKDAAQCIYNKCPDSGYYHLKKRLTQTIVNVLLFFKEEDAHGYFPGKVFLDCLKSVAQAQLLITRGVQDEALQILLKVYDYAEENELLELKILIHNVARNNHLPLEKSGQTSTYDPLLQALEASRELVIAKKYNHHQDADLPFYTTQKNDLKLERMKSAFQRTGSKKIELIYYLSSIRHYNNRKQFNKAYQTGLQLLSLLDAQPILNTNANRFETFIQISRSLLRLKDFEQGASFANIASGLVTSMKEKMVLWETLFYASFNNKKIGEAKNILADAEKFLIYFEKEFAIKVNYLKSYGLFVNREFKKSIKQLNSIKSVAKNFPHLRLWYKFLELMNLAELDEFETFISKTTILVKLFAQDPSIQSARNQGILQVFKTLVKSGFDFEKTHTADLSNIKVLMGGEGEYYWDPLGYELINTGSWIFSKLPSNNCPAYMDMPDSYATNAVPFHY